jgi:hypothetical protein
MIKRKRRRMELEGRKYRKYKRDWRVGMGGNNKIRRSECFIFEGGGERKIGRDKRKIMNRRIKKKRKGVKLVIGVGISKKRSK